MHCLKCLNCFLTSTFASLDQFVKSVMATKFLQHCSQGSNFLSKVSAAPKKTLRLSSPFSSFPSTTLASSSVSPSATAAAAASSSLATSKSDENDQVSVFAFLPYNRFFNFLTETSNILLINYD